MFIKQFNTVYFQLHTYYIFNGIFAFFLEIKISNNSFYFHLSYVKKFNTIFFFGMLYSIKNKIETKNINCLSLHLINNILSNKNYLASLFSYFILNIYTKNIKFVKIITP